MGIFNLTGHLVSLCPSNNSRMLKLFVATFVFFALADAIHVQPELRINCNECIHEMQQLGHLVHGGAADITAFLQENYCPTVEGDIGRCKENIAAQYPHMLEMVVNHYFVDGAIHICEAWGVCMPKNLAELIGKEPRPYTCEECVEGLEWVQGYMEDPLWVAEYTLYLELNFCVGRPDVCPEFVKMHFPPLHAMAFAEFWKPQELCDQQPVCGATRPPPPPMY